MRNMDHSEMNKCLENEMSRKNPFAVIWSVFTWLIVVVVVMTAIMLVGVRIFGFTPYAIISPSMTPDYQVGDLVYVKKVEPEKIKVGDVLTFVANADLTVVTHRVEEVDWESHCFYTKGDANFSRDMAPVAYENVVGVVKFSLPKLGYLSTFLASDFGRCAGIAIVATVILLMILPELLKLTRRNRKKEHLK